jgi:hypothetical protein
MSKPRVRQRPRNRERSAKEQAQRVLQAELRRFVQREKSIAALARQLRRATGEADRGLRELVEFIAERDGDVATGGPAKLAARELRDRAV